MSVASSTGTATSRPPILARVESSTVRAQLAMAKERGVYAFSYVFEGAAGPMFRAPSGQQVLNFGSNNYLGLTTHPRVVAAARAAVDDFGTGCTGSRLMNGTLRLHIALEEELADFYGKEAALVATTGFGANMSVLTTLTRPGDWLVCDRDIHASLLEGAAASGARVSRFRHNDLRSLGQRLARVPAEDGLLVLIEGVYSADGSVAPVADVVAATRPHNGAVLVDEAHALGVLGALGRGACEEAGCLDDVDLVTVTFSKALASCGGAVLGPLDVIEEMRVSARSYLFTASNVPAATAAALAALRLLREQPELPATVRRNGDLLRSVAKASGWRVAPGAGPIVGLPLPSIIHAVIAWRVLMDRGVYCNVFAPPAVPEGQCLLRLSTMATHTEAHFDQLHIALEETREALKGSRVKAPTS